MNLRTVTRPANAKLIRAVVEPASGRGCGMALTVWVVAAKSVTNIAPFNNRVMFCFFIWLSFFSAQFELHCFLLMTVSILYKMSQN